MKFFKSKTKKFTLLLTITLATTALVFLTPSLSFPKETSISSFPQKSYTNIINIKSKKDPLENENQSPTIPRKDSSNSNDVLKKETPLNPKPNKNASPLESSETKNNFNNKKLQTPNSPQPPKKASSKPGLSDWNQEYLTKLKSKLQKIVLDSKELPTSKDFSAFFSDSINSIDQAKNIDDYFEIRRTNWNKIFENYNTWKETYLNKPQLFDYSEDIQDWNNLFSIKSDDIYTWTSDNKKLPTWYYLQDFYIYKLKKQINLYEKYPYYLQPLERLKKLLYYYKNNYGEFVNFQWGIDKNNNFSLDPSKYYSGNYQWIQIDNEYIINWLKYYQRWNWIFVNKEDQIPKIEDKNIKALEINEKFKNNKIISDYMKRQINFAPDSYDKLWTTNPKYPEKVNINDIKKQNSTELYTKHKNTNIQTIDEINKLNLKFNNFQTTLNFEYKKINVENKEYEFQDNSQLKDFDYEKFWKYQNFVELKNKFGFGSIPDFNIYNNLLWDKPNLFSDGYYKSINSELIKPVHKRKKDYDYIIDYTTSLTDEEIKQGKSTFTDAKWINPIPEYKRWFNHWKEILPNIINKNWDDKTKIKAVAYYIATNSLYLSPIKHKFNYNGYGFYNPTQIFTNDPEIQCVGYSMNLAAALTILNIPVRILGGPVVGTPTATFAEGGHAWNEVFVDGRWKAIDLTNWDLNEQTFYNKSAYELKDDEDLFLERNSEWMNQLKLDISSYETTLMFFKNPKEYEYKYLPESI
ncbi:Uncharacterised protein [Mycoplasmopsis citelli]|uniref:Transglutaminase-like domain-containing protein n=1 Tax=Mycoplasmopsis citelli TaxID=171281 RepID=A0A449B2K0_9BACT|nr:transglutaminase-like domain-containing protein [Mycoplasmopsis citelli]VEU74839.1 Uncharacterised protein [Mycoplasmopsis citelli]